MHYEIEITTPSKTFHLNQTFKSSSEAAAFAEKYKDNIHTHGFVTVHSINPTHPLLSRAVLEIECNKDQRYKRF